MKNLKKGLVTLSLAFIMTMALGVVDVHAQDYDFATIKDDFLAGTEYTLTADDNLIFNGETLIGRDGRATIGEGGSATLKHESNVVNATFNGNATINGGSTFFQYVDLGLTKIPINLTISENSVLDILGTLVVPTSNGGSTLINNGEIRIHGGGALELRGSAKYQGTGDLVVFSNLAIYGSSGNNIGDAVISLAESGSVYSEADVSANIIPYKTANDSNTYEVIANENKNYTSVSPNMISEFPYAYAVKAQDIEEIPVTPGEDITNPTDPVEEVSNEVNPETSDGILLFLGLTVVGFAGTALAYRRLHN